MHEAPCASSDTHCSAIVPPTALIMMPMGGGAMPASTRSSRRLTAKKKPICDACQNQGAPLSPGRGDMRSSGVHQRGPTVSPRPPTTRPPPPRPGAAQLALRHEPGGAAACIQLPETFVPPFVEPHMRSHSNSPVSARASISFWRKELHMPSWAFDWPEITHTSPNVMFVRQMLVTPPAQDGQSTATV